MVRKESMSVWTIEQKIESCFAAMFFTVVILSGVSVHDTSSVDRSFGVAVDSTARKTWLAGDINMAVGDMLAADRGILLYTNEKDATGVETAKKLFANRTVEVERDAAELKLLASNDEERNTTDVVIRGNAEWQRAFRDLERLCSVGDVAEASQLEADQALPKYHELDETTAKLLDTESVLLKKNRVTAARTYSHNRTLSFVLVALALLVSGLALIVVRRISAIVLEGKRASESEAHYRQFQLSLMRAIHDVSLDGILVVDKDGIVVWGNKRFLDLWKIAEPNSPDNLAENIVGMADHRLLSKALDRVKYPEAFMKRIQELYEDPGLDDHCEIELKDGRTIERYSTTLRTETGMYRGRVWFCRDTTERKLAEAEMEATNSALEASETRYRNLIDLSPDAILVGRNQQIALANRAAVELFGASSAGDLIGKRFLDMVDPGCLRLLEDAVHRLYERESTAPLMQLQVRRFDGSVVDVEAAVSSFAESDSIGVQAVLRDITRRKQREAKQAQLLRAIEQVAEAIIITDIDGSILYVNPAFEEVTGYTLAEVIGSNPRILKSGRHSDSYYRVLWATLRRGETWSGELINKRKDGTLFNEIATISPIKSDDGIIISYVEVKRDATQEILLRDQLNQAEKWRSMGRLAGGIAHDFNNLLMVMRTYAEMLHDRLPLGDSLRENTEQMLKAVERGASLTGQMLAFSRKQMISPTVISLNAVVNDTAKMLERVIGEDIDFQVDLSESLWAIEADRDQIVQVLMNLCANARDAMPRGGTLRITTGNVTVGARCINTPKYVLYGDYAVLSVRDSGIGVSKEIQSEIFEPFFTTKGPGKGTGLGLAMVYGIIKQGGGYVWLESEVGEGTHFTIYLPRVARAITPTAPARAEPLLRGTETLLVVEDE